MGGDIMSEKNENKEVDTSKEKNKKKIILIVVGVILFAIILFGFLTVNLMLPLI